MNAGRQAQNIEYRLPVHGRIRIGTKNEKGWPISLKTFRFTSSDEIAINAVADEFGGVVKPWLNGKNQEYEVITESHTVPVILPPDPLSGPIWEFWQKGGRLIECDGVEAIQTLVQKDGIEYVTKDCMCEGMKQPKCSPTTRLTVLLHNVPLGGGWVLRTGSANAARELTGMVEIVRMMYQRTLTPAQLVVEPRSSAAGGKTKHYVVPVLRAGATLLELQAETKEIAANGDLLELEE